MNWLAEGRALAFGWTGPDMTWPSSSLRLQDTAAPGSDLIASRVVLPLVNAAGTFGDGCTISPDGKVAFGVASGPGAGQAAIGSVVAFSAAARKPAVSARGHRSRAATRSAAATTCRCGLATPAGTC
jgi:hypothetical protein